MRTKKTPNTDIFYVVCNQVFTELFQVSNFDYDFFA